MKFKQYEMIKLDDEIEGIPIKKGEIVLYLGEIPNMKGHIVFGHKGKIYWGYHPERFIKIPEDEL